MDVGSYRGSAAGRRVGRGRRGAGLRIARLVLAVTLATASLGGPTAWGQEELYVIEDSGFRGAGVGGFGSSARVFARTASGRTPPLRELAEVSGTAGLSDDNFGGIAVDPVRDEVAITELRVVGFTVDEEGHLHTFRAPFILVYARAATLDDAPLRTLMLAGSSTQSARTDPEGVVVDLVHDELIVTNPVSNSVTVHARTASGNVPPLRTLTGAATGLSSPGGVAVDLVHDEMLVANAGNDSITVYPRTANGNVAPSRTVAGPATGLGRPNGLALDLTHDELTVANPLTNGWTTHARGASGDVAPLRTLMGSEPIPALFTPFPASVSVTTSPPLAAAVLPGSRSVQVGAPATAFAALINAGPGPVQACHPTPITPVAGTFEFQTTSAQNQLVGSPNTPANIPAGGLQNFVIEFTPTAPLGPVDVALGFACQNTNRAPVLVGVNTLLLVASDSPVPDVIVQAATPTGDGILTVPGPPGAAAFAAATTNVGAAGAITVAADTGGVALPLGLTVCQTDPASGVCLAPPAPSVTLPIATNATPTFGVFAAAAGPVAFDPAANRIFLRVTDAGGVTRGASSVAVRTQ